MKVVLKRIKKDFLFKFYSAAYRILCAGHTKPMSKAIFRLAITETVICI